MRLGLWYEIRIVVWDWETDNEIALRCLYLYCCIVFVRYPSRTVFGLVFLCVKANILEMPPNVDTQLVTRVWNSKFSLLLMEAH